MANRFDYTLLTIEGVIGKEFVCTFTDERKDNLCYNYKMGIDDDRS